MFVPPADQTSQAARACVHIIATCHSWLTTNRRTTNGQQSANEWSTNGRHVSVGHKVHFYL